MVKNGRKRELNNAGFSLIELLVGITILAIIVGPMLYAFVFSTSMNTKSRRNLYATTVATDIVEGIKANTVQTVAGQMGNYGSYSTEFDLIKLGVNEAGELNYSSGAYSVATTPTATRTVETITHPGPPITTEDVVKYTLPDGPQSKLYFYIDDASPLFEKYDALIELDPTPYQASGEINDLEMPVFNSVGGKSYVQRGADKMLATNTSNIYGLAASVNPGMSAFSDDDLWNMLYRTIRIDVHNDGTDTKVLVSYIYTMKGYGITEVSYTDVDRAVLYDSTKTTEPLDKVYLFYFPMYNSKAGDIHDEIIVNNNNNADSTYTDVGDSQKIDIFLIRQESAVANLLTAELQYRTNVWVKEKSTEADAKTHIRTNIGENMYTRYEPSVPLEVAQGIYKYNATTNPTTVKTALDVRSLIDEKKQDLLYKMNVTVYKSDAIQSGTVDFDGSEKLYEIKGEVLQ